MRAVVVAGGPWEMTDLVREALRSADLLIAADSGAMTLDKHEIAPQLVVGDMDSIDEGTLAELRRQGVAVEVYPARKDLTDTHLALLAAVKRGAAEITLIGALGGDRLDHGIANLALLSNEALAGTRLRLLDGRSEAHVVRDAIELRGAAGDYVSLIPLTERATGITTAGLEYALDDGTLVAAESRGVSNEMTRAEASVRIGGGVLLIIHQHRRRG